MGIDDPLPPHADSAKTAHSMAMKIMRDKMRDLRRKMGTRNALKTSPSPLKGPKSSCLRFDPTSCEVVTMTEKFAIAPEESANVEGEIVQVA